MLDPSQLVLPTAEEIEAAHDAIIEATGGLAGVRVDIGGVVGRIESSLWYRDFANIAEVAALYADTIVNGHYFNDGNKRTGLATMLLFLEMNGYGVVTDEITLADRMVELATHAMNQHALAQWLTSKLQPFPHVL